MSDHIVSYWTRSGETKMTGNKIFAKALPQPFFLGE